MMHRSDCSTNNGPAYPPGPCDCKSDIRFEIHRRGTQFQLSIVKHEGGGYRVFGPKFAGDSVLVAAGPFLTQDVIDGLRSWLDEAEGQLRGAD